MPHGRGSMCGPSELAQPPVARLEAAATASESDGPSAANTKLNLKMPNANHPAQVLKYLVSLLGLLLVHQQASARPQHQEPASWNEIALQAPASLGNLSRDVTELRMVPELRAIRLRWTYVQPNASQARPESFEIRYCELTSWLAEIKCRHRNVSVAPRPEPDEDATAARPASGNANSTVIPPPPGASPGPSQEAELARLIASEPAEPDAAKPAGAGRVSNTFEAHVYDLRALTNYTFEVRVARFAGEPAAGPKPEAGARSLPRPGRRLDLQRAANGELANELPTQRPDKLARAETKPFQAEALKCLANSSEVLINTGRYFGGRISVESQPHDARCQLVGNKSSPQTSYLLRIDHEICRSKVIDSNRIETMILVHENKDILTHNTARFLVQCNIMQKSFTVKASVSLPKINSLNGQSRASSPGFRPATITLLPARPGAPLAPVAVAAGRGADEQQVRLGSMPGIYKLTRAGDASASQASGTGRAAPDEAAGDTGALGRPVSSSPEATVVAVTGSARRSKELPAMETAAKDNTLAGHNYQLELPRPVDVSSKVLFVARASGLTVEHQLPLSRQRGARSEAPLSLIRPGQPARSLLNHLAVQERSIATTAPLLAGINHKQQDDDDDSEKKHSALDASAQSDESNSNAAALAPPVIMTNNHRVAAELVPLAQLATAHPHPGRAAAGSTKQPASVGDFSIRYSAAKVDDYPLGQLEPVDTNKTGQQSAPAQARSRSGRMRQIATTSAAPQMVPRQSEVVGRLGDAWPSPQDLLGAESAPSSDLSALPRDAEATNGPVLPDTNATAPMPNPTLAQNLTGAIIRWSLKALSNLARKSLESLADEREQPLDVGANSSARTPASLEPKQDLRDGFLVEVGGSPTRRAPVFAQPAQLSPSSSPTTSAVGLHQSAGAATQSADLLQSRKPHHLEAPPLPGQSGAHQQSSTTALGPMSSNVTPAATRASSTTRAPVVIQVHRQQRTRPQQPAAVQPAETTRSPRSDESERSAQAAAESQANEEEPTRRSSSLSLIIVLYALLGLAILSALLVFFVATSASSHVQVFKPAFGRHPGRPNRVVPQQPRLGLLSQLNHAIHRNRHTPIITGICSAPKGGIQHQTARNVTPGLDVRSPSVQRRRLDEPSGMERTCGPMESGLRALTSPGGSECGGSIATRSTSAASMSNMSARTGSDLDRQPENYCKNHEQFVYSDYVLLNKSDCLSNECGRESFA